MSKRRAILVEQKAVESWGRCQKALGLVARKTPALWTHYYVRLEIGGRSDGRDCPGVVLWHLALSWPAVLAWLRYSTAQYPVFHSMPDDGEICNSRAGYRVLFFF